MRGRIVKGVSGFYLVRSLSEDIEVICKARGIFKKEKITPVVGDFVDIEILEDGSGIINSIEDRFNEFVRPAISNVDVLLAVVAIKKPDINLQILDRLLVMAEQRQAQAVVVVNKLDLATAEEMDRIKEIYQGIYPIHFVCGLGGEGIPGLIKEIEGKTAALAGPSGAGKSTLLNRILGREEAFTGELSKKTERGKHTTRHVEIFSCCKGTEIFDTPGFSSFDVIEESPDMLAEHFPEIWDLAKNCRFKNCRHIEEPGCAVRRALEDGMERPAEAGQISQSRYDSYLEQMNELINKEKEKY